VDKIFHLLLSTYSKNFFEKEFLFILIFKYGQATLEDSIKSSDFNNSKISQAILTGLFFKSLANKKQPKA
jgi:hypothetical protein